jgi:hypothetical protein
MIMTDAGFAAIEASSRGPLYRVMSWLGLAPRDDEPVVGALPPASPYSAVPPRRPANRTIRESGRLAESYAFNALVSARNGRYAEAESYFREAFVLDRTLSPSKLANFWQLSRHAQEAASRALIACGRDDDAVDLVREMSDRAMRVTRPELARAAS